MEMELQQVLAPLRAGALNTVNLQQADERAQHNEMEPWTTFFLPVRK